MKSSNIRTEEVLKLEKNIAGLKNEIDRTCKKIGRDMKSITIIAATKYASAEQVSTVSSLGLNNFGENRAEQLEEKYSKVKKESIWHFIGHLQRRKVKVVVPRVDTFNR